MKIKGAISTPALRRRSKATKRWEDGYTWCIRVPQGDLRPIYGVCDFFLDQESAVDAARGIAAALGWGV